MRIVVVGFKGVVGNATFQLFSRLNYEVYGVDVSNVPIESDITFICLPEDKITPEELSRHKTKLYVVRSTVVPGTCEALQNKLNIHVLHNPEFLRESTAVLDEFNPDRILIGECCHRHSNMVADLYKPLRRPILRASSRATELTKLACNGWLATVISYWNSIEQIAWHYGVSGTEVGMLASTDSRISWYGSRFHSQFAGKCLPKDTAHLMKLAEGCGADTSLFKAVMEVNQKI